MMKKKIFYTHTISLILLFTLMQTACLHRFRYVERPMPKPTDEIYEQEIIYNQSSTEPPTSYQEFYDELSPYGSWIDYPSYGYVWAPRVSVDFHPYATDGHWVMTNFGWTWISDFRWGWAAFHYGRWAYEPLYGWLWVPGREWGPAWVDWREDNDYFGWAPLGPFGNISVSVSCPFDHYRFVPRRYFTHRQLYNYYADRHNNTIIINHTTVINETHVVNKKKYYYGPRRENVEKAVGQKINAAEIYDNPKPDADVVEKDRVKVYRPRMDNEKPNTPKASPKRVASTSDLQPIPSDRRLTPSVKRETRQNTEGVVSPTQERETRQREAPQEKPTVQEKSVPKYEPRREEMPQEKPNVNPKPVPKYEPRREEVPQEKPNVNPKPVPKYEPRREERQPREREMPQEKPDVKPRPVPKYEPRREEAPQNKPTKIPPKTEPTRRDNPVPIKVPPKKKNKDDNN
jgi:hypothetical protein